MGGHGPGGMPMAQYRKEQNQKVAIEKLRPILAEGSEIETEYIFKSSNYCVIDVRPSAKWAELDPADFVQLVGHAAIFRVDNRHQKDGLNRVGLGVGIPSRGGVIEPSQYVVQKLGRALHDNPSSLKQISK